MCHSRHSPRQCCTSCDKRLGCRLKDQALMMSCRIHRRNFHLLLPSRSIRNWAIARYLLPCRHNVADCAAFSFHEAVAS